MRVAATDLAILTAFCRPYRDEQRRFPCPATNNEILEELGKNGVYLDLDALRGHLRNLYANFGVEDGLNPAQKRARLAELVYESGVIPGWGEPETPMPPEPASAPPGQGETREPRRSATKPAIRARLAGLPRDRVRLIGGVAAVLVGLAVVLGVGLIAGGDEGPPEERVPIIDPSSMGGASGEVTYCTGKDVASSADGRAHQHQTAVDAFNDRFGPKLHAHLRRFSEDATVRYDQFRRLQRSRSDDCDVFYSDVVWTADFAHNNWLRDLSAYAKPRLTSYVPAMREAVAFEGRVWGVPKQADAGLLYYNTSTVSNSPRTYQQLYEQAAERPTKRLRYQGDAYEGLTVNFLELAYAIGARDIITPERKANIDQPQALRALRFMVDGLKNRVAPRVIVNQTEEQSLRAFGRARADFMRNWPYASAALRGPKYPKVAGKVGVVPLPSWEGRPAVSVLGGQVLVISAYSDNPAGALKLVDFLSSPQVVKRDATQFSLAPALVSLWQDTDVRKKLPAFADLKSAINNAKLRPETPNYPAVSEAIYKNVNRALMRRLSPEEALGAANADIQLALDEAYHGR